ncbi:MAG: hypothetical protein RB191_19480 [Terriglobia bacterium]|nr:hypothetical protein [Terriglobia bacterium]
MSLARSRVFSTAHFYGRMARRTAVLALFASMVLPQCSAVKFHQNHVTGVYLSRDAQILQALTRHTPGTYWINGYRMTVTQQTQICWHDSALQFHPGLSRAGQPFSRLSINSPCETTLPATDFKDVWLQYRGVQKIPFRLEFEFKVTATRIDVWKSDTKGNPPSSQSTVPRPAWKTLCASAPPHELRYPNEGPIDVVCNAKVNSYVENVFSALLKPSAITPDAPIAKQEIPRFYVVRPFQVRHNYDFEAIDGLLMSEREIDGYPAYENPHAHSTVQEIVYAPDGTVLIADTGLANLKNEAQFAALLSYSLVMEQQHLIQHLFLVQRARFKTWNFNNETNSTNNIKGTFFFVGQITAQALRLGIRRMYLAGFDVRYAPLAWAVAQGKRIKGPVDEPHKHMPWYATYGFNYISQLYPDVDYSKLKRGEKEYAEFLDELRQADPEAFAGKK